MEIITATNLTFCPRETKKNGTRRQERKIETYFPNEKRKHRTRRRERKFETQHDAPRVERTNLAKKKQHRQLRRPINLPLHKQPLSIASDCFFLKKKDQYSKTADMLRYSRAALATAVALQFAQHITPASHHTKSLCTNHMPAAIPCLQARTPEDLRTPLRSRSAAALPSSESPGGFVETCQGCNSGKTRRRTRAWRPWSQTLRCAYLHRCESTRPGGHLSTRRRNTFCPSRTRNPGRGVLSS